MNYYRVLDDEEVLLGTFTDFHEAHDAASTIAGDCVVEYLLNGAWYCIATFCDGIETFPW